MVKRPPVPTLATVRLTAGRQPGHRGDLLRRGPGHQPVRSLQHPGQLIIIQLLQTLTASQIEQCRQDGIGSQLVTPAPLGKHRPGRPGVRVRIPIIRTLVEIPARGLTVSRIPVLQHPVARIQGLAFPVTGSRSG